MEFHKYNFTDEEKNIICEYYDFFYNNQDEHLGIEPVSKEDFENTLWTRDFIPDVCLLWYDNQSNYAGMYYRGNLRGKVMFLCHAEPNYAPLFKNISSFLANVKNGVIYDLHVPNLGVCDYPCDYPAKVLTEEEKEQNLSLAKEYLAGIKGVDDDVDVQMALKAWYLMPAKYLDLLIPLMKSGNMYIEQDIPYIFAFHNYRDAIPALREASENGSIYIKDSAKRALAEIRKQYETSKRIL